MRFRSVLLCAALAAHVASLAPAQSAARDDDDAARARAGVRERRMIPLTSILDWIETRYHGHAIEIELEEENGEPPTYEVEWLTPGGQVVEFEFDASTGELLETEGEGLEEARK